MLLYRNHTRFPAIVTLKLEVGGDEPKLALQIGADMIFEKIMAASGVHDVLVGAGKELHTVGQIPGVFLAARAAQ